MDRENVLSKLAGLTKLPANELKDMCKIPVWQRAAHLIVLPKIFKT